MSTVSEYCYPVEFVCEHTASRSRVFVELISPHRAFPKAVKAVLTCADAELAERAAEVLNLVGNHPTCRKLAESIEKELPAAPAASFRQALERVEAHQWPISDMGPVRTDTARQEQPGDPDPPDFARLFPVDDHECGDGCPATHLTPRTAAALYDALTALSDEAYDDVAEFGNEPVGRGDGIEWSVFAMLPHVTWHTSADWRRNFARACDDLAADLADGRLPVPRCEAEHMAVHLAIEDAPNYLPDRDSTGDSEPPVLPGSRLDYDWAGCTELLCTKRRVVLVYVAEASEGDLVLDAEAGPDVWFAWFPGTEARDPERGFRRLPGAVVTQIQPRLASVHGLHR